MVKLTEQAIATRQRLQRVSAISDLLGRS